MIVCDEHAVVALTPVVGRKRIAAVRWNAVPCRTSSIFGTLQTLMPTLSMSAVGDEADIANSRANVRS